MAAFEDRIQALMDEVYTEWQKDENKGKGRREILDGFSEAHQIATLFGNFNYQVENGGISQWIYNGYFQDDAEKLAEYLETGAKFDERFKKILGDINQLDEHAQETECDRYGNFHTSDYSEDGFIGDIIDCDAFDTWYYAHCGNEDWWKTVCEMIDNTAVIEAVPALPDEHGGGEAGHSHPLRVYIENARDDNIGGFTMPLPATLADFQPFLESTEITGRQDIKIAEVMSDIDGLGELLSEAIAGTMSKDALDELNYLAAKIAAMDSNGLEVFAAVTEAKRHCGSVAEIINVAENLSCFDLQPAFSAEQYGEFLLDTDYDACAEAAARLEKSEDPAERALLKHLTRLERAADAEKYGYNAAKEEDGVFTKRGYLTENESAFKEIYRGQEDIPVEYRVIAPSAEEAQKSVSVMVTDTDLAALLMEMHALGGEYMRDAKYNISALITKGDDFLVMAHPHMLTVTPVDLVFRGDTDEHRAWTRRDGAPEDARCFVMSVTSRDGGQITGDLCETDFSALRGFFQTFNVSFAYLDAEMKDGTSRSITLDEWNGMDRADRDQLKSWKKYYTPADEAKISTCISTLRWAVTNRRQYVTPEELVTQMSARFMARSDHPQPGMLRVARDAAKEILAQNTAPVFRLMEGTAERLSPVYAVKTGLWYSSDREFAIRREDLPQAGKWAKRGAEDLLRQAERGERNKSKAAERE